VTLETDPASAFSPDFQTEFDRLMRLRRDVRHFLPDPVDPDLLSQALDAFHAAPSVGLSQPWRLIRVESPHLRRAARDNFETANARALTGYSGEKAASYAKIKLAGMDRAPVQLAIFSDESTTQGGGLGAGSMPEMRAYSVVAAVTLFWLALRARGLGLGWVSILDPVQLASDLQVDQNWRLVGYFCIGWPERVSDTPELEQIGWERRRAALPIETR
jgi:5,6-dimethylbenzimidazole synthase